VIKGYYDLLLAGSLGRLTDKQQTFFEESKTVANAWCVWCPCS